VLRTIVSFIIYYISQFCVVKTKCLRSLALVAHACKEAEIRRIAVPNQPWQVVHESFSQKYPSQERVDGVAQV
jgi:hypothetical protein